MFPIDGEGVFFNFFFFGPPTNLVLLDGEGVLFFFNFFFVPPPKPHAALGANLCPWSEEI